jgi:hypothetical protein
LPLLDGLRAAHRPGRIDEHLERGLRVLAEEAGEQFLDRGLAGVHRAGFVHQLAGVEKHPAERGRVAGVERLDGGLRLPDDRLLERRERRLLGDRSRIEDDREQQGRERRAAEGLERAHGHDELPGEENPGG